MKIGILTHQYINNYGAFLQAWALRKAVSELFPEDEVYIINYVNIKHFIINTGGWFRFYKSRENLTCWLKKVKLPFVFAKARKENMILTKRCFNAKQINSLDLDYIIVGSDEVWNIKDSKGNAAVKFGQGIDCKHLVAYAPSVGQTKFSEKIPEYVVSGMNKFQAISSRDQMTSELVESVTGNVPIKVLDPTLLVEFPKKSIDIKQPYILFYYCEKLPKKIKQQIFQYAKTNGLKVYGAGECDKEYSDITVDITPFEWVAMFQNAEYVFTGTFHGAVFSIINRKPFNVYLTNQSRIKKVKALLADLNIQNREITKNYKFDLEKMRHEIDYDATFQKIESKRKESLNFIKKKKKKKSEEL